MSGAFQEYLIKIAIEQENITLESPDTDAIKDSLEALSVSAIRSTEITSSQFAKVQIAIFEAQGELRIFNQGLKDAKDEAGDSSSGIASSFGIVKVAADGMKSGMNAATDETADGMREIEAGVDGFVDTFGAIHTGSEAMKSFAAASGGAAKATENVGGSAVKSAASLVPLSAGLAAIVAIIGAVTYAILEHNRVVAEEIALQKRRRLAMAETAGQVAEMHQTQMKAVSANRDLQREMAGVVNQGDEQTKSAEQYNLVLKDQAELRQRIFKSAVAQQGTSSAEKELITQRDSFDATIEQAKESERLRGIQHAEDIMAVHQKDNAFAAESLRLAKKKVDIVKDEQKGLRAKIAASEKMIELAQKEIDKRKKIQETITQNIGKLSNKDKAELKHILKKKEGGKKLTDREVFRLQDLAPTEGINEEAEKRAKKNGTSLRKRAEGVFTATKKPATAPEKTVAEQTKKLEEMKKQLKAGDELLNDVVAALLVTSQNNELLARRVAQNKEFQERLILNLGVKK